MPSRYTHTSIKKNKDGRRVFKPTIYPKIPIKDSDIFIYPKFGDRLDNLAHKYYDDVSLWWIIAKANGIVGRSVIPTATLLRIPSNIAGIIGKFKELNR